MTDQHAEEAARAAMYALLGRLFYDGPDEALLRGISAAGGLMAASSSSLAEAWLALARACGTAGAEVRQEYEDLFIGPGQAEISLYLSHYWPAAARQKVLVDLRADLARYGAARRPGVGEPEDHAAALFDLMRLLALRTGEQDWGTQKRVFERYVAPAYGSLCDAIARHPAARFYRLVAAVCAAFLDLEARAFAAE